VVQQAAADRCRALFSTCELAEWPQPPELSDGMLSSVLWVTLLTEHVGPHAGRLSDLVYRLIARDTIEDKMLALGARKAQLFASVLDDGNAFSSALTADDVRELIS